MKKLLLMLDLFLTGLLVFALLMPMPARADTLPKKFLGEWCQLPGSLRDENGKYLGHAFDRDPDCKNIFSAVGDLPVERGKITITKRGIKSENGCIFTKIKVIDKNSVRVWCKDKGSMRMILSDNELSLM
jgi:hypothetical protein